MPHGTCGGHARHAPTGLGLWDGEQVGDVRYNRCLSEMAKNGQERAILEIPKDYLVDFIGVIIFFGRASCRRVVGFRIFARRSLSVLQEAAFPKDSAIPRFLAEFTLSYANVIGSDRSHTSIPPHL